MGAPKIPEGWVRVKSGVAMLGDMACNATGKWVHIEDEFFGSKVGVNAMVFIKLIRLKHVVLLQHELAAARAERDALRGMLLKDGYGTECGVLLEVFNHDLLPNGKISEGRIWFTTRAEAEAALDAAVKAKGGG